MKLLGKPTVTIFCNHVADDPGPEEGNVGSSHGKVPGQQPAPCRRSHQG